MMNKDKRWLFNTHRTFTNAVLIIIISALIPYSVQAYRNFRFYRLTRIADLNFHDKNYSKASALWNKAIVFSMDNGAECRRSIKRATALDESRASFVKAMECINKKEYIDAIKYFNAVISEDRANYDNAQIKIPQCKKAFIDHQLKLAEQLALNASYEEAIKLLNHAKNNLYDKQFDLAIGRFSDISRNHSVGNHVLGITNKAEEPQFIPRTRRGIPVLMYHSVDIHNGNLLKLAKNKFNDQMHYLKKNGYTTLGLDELYACLNEQMEMPPKPVVLTFDDGYSDNYFHAFPILKELQLKATVFMITNYIDSNTAFLNRFQIKEMSLNGVTVESHTTNHEDLSTLSYTAQYKILKSSKEKLQQITNRPILYLAYPTGRYNTQTEKAVRDAGFLMAFTTKPGFARPDNGMYFLRRVRINSDITLDGFKGLL